LDAFTRTVELPTLDGAEKLFKDAAESADGEDLLFSIDAGVGSIKEILRQGTIRDTDKAEGVRKGLREIKTLRNGLLVGEEEEDSKGEAKEELKAKFAEQMEVITTDSDFLHEKKKQGNLHRRRGKQHEFSIDDWESKLLRKLESPAKPLPAGSDPQVLLERLIHPFDPTS